MKIPRLVLTAWFYEKFLKWKIRDAVLRWYFRWKVKRGLYVLESLDGMMDKAGYQRHERRQFWREFTAKQGAREKLWERMR